MKEQISEKFAREKAELLWEEYKNTYSTFKGDKRYNLIETMVKAYQQAIKSFAEEKK